MKNGVLYSTPKAAELLGISRCRIGQLIRRGRIKGIRVGKDWMISACEVDRFGKIKRKPGRPWPKRVLVK